MLHLVTLVTSYFLRITLLSNYLLPLLSILAEKTLLKIACHFLLLLVGFDTLTYRKDYDRSPILVGHQSPPATKGAEPPASIFLATSGTGTVARG